MRPNRITWKAGCAAALWCGALAVANAAYADDLRISTLGNCSIALLDRDNEINPYDFGRNPAYLEADFEDSYIRFVASLAERRGDLRRPYDPRLENTLFAEFQGRKRLGPRHVASGYFRYERLRQRELVHSLEIDQYNDPFYMTDLTTGDFEHWGPVMSADYSLKLTPKVAIGAGVDYAISTGLKDQYTRPEIVHTYTRASLGLVASPAKEWLVGAVVRPVRLQNRTNFDKTDEGYDNIILRYSGDSIYEIRSFSSYNVREISNGTELAAQGFYSTDRFAAGAIASYRFADNMIEYNITNPTEAGYWEDEAYDIRCLARYSPASLPLVFGVNAEVLNQDGWAKRPRFEDVLLYENAVRLRAGGAGVSWTHRPLHLTVSAEYILRSYVIEANDYGAHAFQRREFTQNVGRLGVEYAAYQVFAVRAGAEAIDCLADRWLKLPFNTDRYRLTAGASYQWHWWRVEAEVLYGWHTAETAPYDELERTDIGGILWFTRLER